MDPAGQDASSDGLANGQRVSMHIRIWEAFHPEGSFPGLDENPDAASHAPMRGEQR